MKKKIRRLTKVEKILVTFLALVALISGYQVIKAFYIQHTDIQTVEGGIYAEGAVGKIGPLNPLFVQYGTVTHDLAQLIFSGLTKYDPQTGDIVPDLADFKVSSDGKEYTFVIKEGAHWHDGRSVTSNDVVFTYETVIKDPAFSGFILNHNDYSGMKVAKVDDRTVQFFLDKPDSFFLVKTLTGILPEHALIDVPVEFLSESPFSDTPIGSGRYQFVSLLPVNDHVEVSLEAFDDFYGEVPHIENILIKVFSDNKDLGKHLGELDGVRNVSDDLAEKILKKGNLVVHRYHLPQYVAAFINTESPKLKNTKVRLALQLGTDKESLLNTIDETLMVDTPLMEIDQSNWMHQYSVKKANGALFDTEWKLPATDEFDAPVASDIAESADSVADGPTEDESDASVAEVSGTSEVIYINGPNGGKDWNTTQDRFTITGTTPPKTKEVIVNDYTLRKYVPGTKAWSYVASTGYKNLEKGENVYNVYVVDFNGEKTLIDAITIIYGDSDFFQREDNEKRVEENEGAQTLPIRVNRKGETLTLRLIAPKTPAIYETVGTILAGQWQKIGVDLQVDILEKDAFQDALTKRDYDLVIFGQNLGYNLDAYPYWHSSQAKEGGFNLSQFKHFVVDSLLEKARRDYEVEARMKTLNDIQEIISTEVPAVFLYSPTYALAQSETIQNASFDNLATTSDRFAQIEQWYGRVDRKLKEGVTPFTFIGWLFKQF